MSKKLAVNYGELTAGETQIKIGPSWISRLIGYLLLLVVVVVVVFIMSLDLKLANPRGQATSLWLLLLFTTYLALRFAGAWGYRLSIDGRRQQISIDKRWLFIPVMRKQMEFKEVKSVVYQKSSQEFGPQRTMKPAQICLQLRSGEHILVASISNPQPEETEQDAQDIARRISKIVGCPWIER